ncbi:hypothetical protein HK102_009588 [Quaeritorhiza haematococci]|nr:hypothetical protein HK102_009588 [Quaeritorhiza haematococci]
MSTATTLTASAPPSLGTRLDKLDTPHASHDTTTKTDKLANPPPLPSHSVSAAPTTSTSHQQHHHAITVRKHHHHHTSSKSQAASTKSRLPIGNKYVLDPDHHDITPEHRAFMRHKLYGAGRENRPYPYSYIEFGQYNVPFADVAPPPWKTTCETHFTPKSMDVAKAHKENREVADFIKASHFSIKYAETDEANQQATGTFQTTMKKDFVPKETKPVQPGAHARAFLKKLQLHPPIHRDENELTNNKNTVYVVSFQNGGGVPPLWNKHNNPIMQREKGNPNRTHLVLGQEQTEADGANETSSDQRGKWESVTRSNFGAPPVLPHIKAQGLSQSSNVLEYPDLDPGVVQSTQKEDFQLDKSIDRRQLIVDASTYLPNLKDNHFSFGGYTEPTPADSEYRKAFRPGSARMTALCDDASVKTAGIGVVGTLHHSMTHPHLRKINGNKVVTQHEVNERGGEQTGRRPVEHVNLSAEYGMRSHVLKESDPQVDADGASDGQTAGKRATTKNQAAGLLSASARKSNSIYSADCFDGVKYPHVVSSVPLDVETEHYIKSTTQLDFVPPQPRQTGSDPVGGPVMIQFPYKTYNPVAAAIAHDDAGATVQTGYSSIVKSDFQNPTQNTSFSTLVQDFRQAAELNTHIGKDIRSHHFNIGSEFESGSNSRAGSAKGKVLTTQQAHFSPKPLGQAIHDAKSAVSAARTRHRENLVFENTLNDTVTRYPADPNTFVSVSKSTYGNFPSGSLSTSNNTTSAADNNHQQQSQQTHSTTGTEVAVSHRTRPEEIDAEMDQQVRPHEGEQEGICENAANQKGGLRHKYLAPDHFDAYYIHVDCCACRRCKKPLISSNSTEEVGAREAVSDVAAAPSQNEPDASDSASAALDNSTQTNAPVVDGGITQQPQEQKRRKLRWASQLSAAQGIVPGINPAATTQKTPVPKIPLPHHRNQHYNYDYVSTSQRSYVLPEIMLYRQK